MLSNFSRSTVEMLPRYPLVQQHRINPRLGGQIFVSDSCRVSSRRNTVPERLRALYQSVSPCGKVSGGGGAPGRRCVLVTRKSVVSELVMGRDARDASPPVISVPSPTRRPMAPDSIADRSNPGPRARLASPRPAVSSILVNFARSRRAISKRPIFLADPVPPTFPADAKKRRNSGPSSLRWDAQSSVDVA